MVTRTSKSYDDNTLHYELMVFHVYILHTFQVTSVIIYYSSYHSSLNHDNCFIIHV